MFGHGEKRGSIGRVDMKMGLSSLGGCIIQGARGIMTVQPQTALALREKGPTCRSKQRLFFQFCQGRKEAVHSVKPRGNTTASGQVCYLCTVNIRKKKGTEHESNSATKENKRHLETKSKILYTQPVQPPGSSNVDYCRPLLGLDAYSSSHQLFSVVFRLPMPSPAILMPFSTTGSLS